jgi:DNA-binding transcriptional ArsR family regulator
MSNSCSYKWGPEHLRLDELKLPNQPRPATRARRGTFERYIAGPIDGAWVLEARKLGVTALLAGLVLWHLKGLRKSVSFAVSNLTMEPWGISADAKTRALVKLERAGLIRVQRRGKRSPVVTLITKLPALRHDHGLKETPHEQ